MKRTVLGLASGLIFLFGSMSVFAGGPPVLPPALKMPSHLGVEAGELAQFTTTRDQDGDYEGWQLRTGDGAVTEYPDNADFFVVPEGKVLVITDVYIDGSTTAAGAISLNISQGANTASVFVWGFDGFSSYREHMTSGFFVPPGWKLNLPNISTSFNPIVRLEGYFATL